MSASINAIPDTIQWRDNNGPEETGYAAWRHIDNTWQLRTVLATPNTKGIFMIDITGPFANHSGSAPLTNETFFYAWPNDWGYTTFPTVSGQIDFSFKTTEASTATFHATLENGKEIIGSFNLGLSPSGQWKLADEEIQRIRKELK